MIPCRGSDHSSKDLEEGLPELTPALGIDKSVLLVLEVLCIRSL